MKNISMKLAGSAAIIIVFVVLAGCLAPNKTGRDGMLLECEMLGGTNIPQPDGSTITACCYDTGCWICDENGNDCDFEPAYFSPVWEDAPFFDKIYISRQQSEIDQLKQEMAELRTLLKTFVKNASAD